jgi:hypothetical protein
LAEISLVIVSQRGGAALLDTVASFVDATRGDAEIVVSECADDDSADRIRARWPDVHVVHRDGEWSIPELRAAGLGAARSPIVAMTSDSCSPAPGWFAALRRAHADRPDAVGGAIENGSTQRLIDWAVFFCEYGRYMTPLPPKPAEDLPGHNVSYSRAALTAIDDLVARGTWEPLWHWRLASRGCRLVRDGSLLVVLTRRFTFSGFVSERFDYGRSFAAQRVAGASAARRALFTIGCAVLPVVVVVRILRDVLPKRRHLAWLLLSLPYLAVFACVWAAGEAVGYATGATKRVGAACA